MEEQNQRESIRPAKMQGKQSEAPASPYRGTGYRSIAFGTWAVGDAARRFEERKRGRSSGAEKAERQRREEGERQNNSHSPPKGLEPSSSIPRPAGESSPIQSSLSLGDIRHRQFVAMNGAAGPNGSDLYSSREYVRHIVQDCCGGGGQEGQNVENVSIAASLPPLACFNRSLETLHLSPSSLLHHNQPSCSSPVPSRISCPPTSRKPHHQHQHQQRFAFIVDPLKARPGAGGGGGGMRNRTKSLDNGLKVCLGGRHRKDRIGEGEGNEPMGAMGSARDVGSKRACAAGPMEGGSPLPGHSRLDQAKQFLRRFYASSTMRLARRKQKEPCEQPQQQKQQQPPGALMYSSAMGPFFEFRRPCAEELPLLPYNIHFAVDSPDCSDSDDEDDEEEGQGQGMASAGGHQSAAGMGEEGISPTLTPASSSSSPSTSSSSARTSSSSGLALTMAGIGDLIIPDSLTMPKFLANSADLAASSPDSALGGSPSESAGGQGSLPSASSSRSSDSEGKKGKKNGGTAQMTMREGPGTPSRMGGPAERRFADWNELFQYLRREIVEMNMRDAQILHNLETIQAELNGVRQLQQQTSSGRRRR